MSTGQNIDDGYFVPTEPYPSNQQMDTNISFNQPVFGNEVRASPPGEWFGQDMPLDTQIETFPSPPTGMDYQYSSPMSPMSPMGQMQSPSGKISQSPAEVDYDNEPPLLEELGIDFKDIWKKTKLVLLPTGKMTRQDAGESDLAGPLCFCLLLSFCLLLTGKIYLGYIYGFATLGCTALYIILNLMNDEGTAISIDRTASILGYSLLPIVLFSAFNIVLNLKGYVGAFLAVITIFWCTFSATRCIEALLNMQEQRYLVAYPVSLLYSCFALLTVF